MRIRSAMRDSGIDDLVPGRSERSLAFQRLWAEIPRSGFIPDKTAFRPERFASFLPDIYLVELNPEVERRLIIRLAGQNIRDHLGTDIKGMNYADFVPPEHRELSGTSMHRMFGARPCGRWVRKEIVHTQGYRERIEMTQLPMLDTHDGTHLVLGIIEGFGESLPDGNDGTGFRFESFEAEHFIDTGAGLPA